MVPIPARKGANVLTTGINLPMKMVFLPNLSKYRVVRSMYSFLTISGNRSRKTFSPTWRPSQ